MPDRCAIYTRCSISDQTTTNQIRKLKEIANLKGLTVVTEFTDEAISGAKGRDRITGFDSLIKGAVKKDFDIILVWNVDRLSRSLSHLVSFLEEIHSVDCDLYIHKQALDSRRPAGKGLFGMCGIFAEFEPSLFSERIKSGQARAKAMGKHIGRPSSLNEGLVHSIKYMRDQGVGIRKIATDLKVGVSTVYKVREAA